MSARGSTAKISSLSSMSPAPLAAGSDRVWTLTFILAFLALVGIGLGLVRLSFCCFILCSRLGLAIERATGFLLRGDRGNFLITREGWDLVNRRVVDQTGSRHFNLVLLHLLDDAGRVRRVLVARKLDGVGDGQPAALVARNRALDEQQTPDRIGADDFKVLLGPIARAHVASHLFVLENLARILALAG